MVWAACCLCFFAFLRAGEMTVKAYDASVHLSVQDISVDDSKNPSILRVWIKQSKTDHFRKGVDLYVGKTASQLCPVAAMLSYLCVAWTVILLRRWVSTISLAVHGCGKGWPVQSWDRRRQQLSPQLPYWCCYNSC